MDEIVKHINDTNASYRQLSAGDAKNTDLFLDNEHFELFKDSSSQITVRYNKENLSKAILFIASILPRKYDQSAIHKIVPYSREFVTDQLAILDALFVQNGVPVETITQEWNARKDVPQKNGKIDSRFYFNGLLKDVSFIDHSGVKCDTKFTIRNYFAGGFSDLHIKKADDGVFDVLITNVNTPYEDDKEDGLEDIEFTPSHSAPLQKIFFGSPGTGKSFFVKTKVLNGVSDEFIFRTTFHPDSDYASFVGCYKPRMNGGRIEYAFTPQVFTKAYCKAWKNPGRQVYLVIEELNRGNCAQIFGDLFQLLDRSNGVSEYPIDADEDMKDYLETALNDVSDGEQDGSEGIAGGKLRLPANFNIVATMNTSDQSLFPMDSAFKRRWDWAYVPTKSSYDKSWKMVLDFDKNGTDTENSKIITGEQVYIWSVFLEAINKRILSATHSEDKQLGFWFVTPKQGNDISISEFVSKVVFYLWNDVFKDMGPKESNPFTITGENGEKTVMNFNSFFEDNKYGETVESLGALHTFFHNLGLTPELAMRTAAETETTEEDTSEDSAE